MSLVMYYITWAIFLAGIAFFGWASIFRPDFRRDVFGGEQGEAKILGFITVKGAAIILIFGLFLGGILVVFSVVEKIDDRQFDANVANLRTSLDSNTAALNAAQKTIDALQVEAKRLVFRPIDETDIPYCNNAGSPEPKAVAFHDSLGRPNLALLASAQATASSLIPSMAPGEKEAVGSRHRFSYINDGWYNNCRSWIAERTPAWVAVDLGDVYEITGIAFGSEHEAYYNDRAALRFKVEVATNNTDWKLAHQQDTDDPIRGTTAFNFSNSMLARTVRLTILKSSPPNYPTSPGAVRVDELEIYGLRGK